MVVPQFIGCYLSLVHIESQRHNREWYQHLTARRCRQHMEMRAEDIQGWDERYCIIGKSYLGIGLDLLEILECHFVANPHSIRLSVCAITTVAVECCLVLTGAEDYWVQQWPCWTLQHGKPIIWPVLLQLLNGSPQCIPSILYLTVKG